MTISTTIIKNSYSGDGSNLDFTYSFKISADSEMLVIIRSSTGTETTKTLTTNYTVSGAGDAGGGTVSFVSGQAPASTETVILRRNTTQTQALDLIENDNLPANSLETAFDKNLAIAQELQEQLDRSFKVSRTTTITTPEFTEDASTRASKTLGFDSTGNVLQTVADFLPAGGDSAMFTYSTTTTDADPGSGKFRLNNATPSSATIAYFDDAEYNGTDISAWVQSWDDVSGNDTNRGRIRISKAQSLDTWIVYKVSGSITDASGYSKVTLVHIDSAGTFADTDKCWVSFTASGEDGAIPGYYYKFDTGTSDADPGAGEIAFNNGTYASVTAIYIDDADANGATTSADVLTWDDSTSTIKGYLHIVDINDSSTYARFSITGSSSDASGYNKLAVTHLVSNNTFSAADELSVHFTRQGDKGDTGSTGNTGNTGSTGSTGASGTNSQLSMTWSSSTSDADPGSGKIAFNHGTLSSVSILYVDDADDASADISGYVQSWDDVSNSTARGIVTITKEGTASTYAIFKVSGAVTDASGYTKVPVTHVVSNGSFSNTDGVGVHFGFSGADSAVQLTGSTDNTIVTVTGSNAIAGEANLTFDGTNLLIGSTGKLYLNDAGGEHISGNGSILSIAGGNEIDLTATAIDINGTCDVSGISTFSAANVTQQAITSSSNAVAWDASAKPNAYHQTTENTTFSAPSNAVEGAFICVEINYNGSHSIGWNTVFEFSASTEPTETASDGKTDIHIFKYNGAIWQEVGRTMNLSES